MFSTRTKRQGIGDWLSRGRGRCRRTRRLPRSRFAIEQLEQKRLLAGNVFLVAPGDSIQDAVDNASEADIILIKPGEYNESLDIDKSLIVAGLGCRPTDVVITPDGDPDVDGITVEAGVNFVVFKNFQVTGWENDGIVIGVENEIVAPAETLQFNQINGDTRVTMFRVVADNNGDDGIELNTVGCVHLVCVTAESNDGDGLDIDGASGSVTIAWSRFNENGDEESDHGLDLDDLEDRLVITGVTAKNNYDDGLSVEVAEEIKILASDFSFNGILTTGGFGYEDADGINLSSVGDVTLCGVTASFNYEDGLDIDSDNGLNGDVTIKSSKFIGNGTADEETDGDGMDLDDIGDLVLSCVDSTGNFGNGLVVEDAGDVKLYFSHFDDNGDDGVDLAEVDDVLATGIAANRNGDDGFDVDGANRVAIFFSKFNDNDDDGVDIDGLVNTPPKLVFVRATGNGDNDIEPTNT